MSEEEAIGICKNIIRAINGETYYSYSKEQDKAAIDTILDLYNKQKEEIKAMTLNYEALASICSPMLQKIKDDYIHKDKIREKIKELKECRMRAISDIGLQIFNAEISMLEQLLED